MVESRRRPIHLLIFIGDFFRHVHLQFLIVLLNILLQVCRPLGYLAQRIRHLIKLAVQYVLLAAHLVDSALHVPSALVYCRLRGASQALATTREHMTPVRSTHAVHAHGYRRLFNSLLHDACCDGSCCPFGGARTISRCNRHILILDTLASSRIDL